MLREVIDAYVGHVPGSDRVVVVLRSKGDTENHLVGLLKFWTLVRWRPQRSLQDACKELIGKEIDL